MYVSRKFLLFLREVASYQKLFHDCSFMMHCHLVYGEKVVRYTRLKLFARKEAEEGVSQILSAGSDTACDNTLPRHIEIFLEAARSPEGMSVRWHLKYQKRIKNASKFKI